jgi:protein-S-isoprenylcysteine O-methyltransferase Ste14
MEKLIVLRALFAILVIAAIVPRIIQKLKKVESVGCIGINKKLFFLGKISLFTSFILIHLQVRFGNLSLFAKNDVFFWICIALVTIGVVLFTLAILNLGTFSLRFGLGLYLMALGSAIYVQNPINWMLVIIALTIHHKIIMAEEVFLENRFGDEWTEYRNKVRRYI